MYSHSYNMPCCDNNMYYQNYQNVNYGRSPSNNRFFFPGGFILPFTAGLLTGPLVFRPRPYPAPYPYPVPYYPYPPRPYPVYY